MSLIGRDLRQYSLITWLFERVFCLLQRLSPISLMGTPVEVHNSDAYKADPHGQSSRRALIIDLYVILWLVLEILMFVCLNNFELPLAIYRIFAVYRIIDVLQATVNLSIFDRMRLRGVYRLASVERTLILSFLNFLELAVCFGVLYLTFPNSLKPYPDWGDALYFSVATQLTIGYGDIVPQGFARFIAAAQGVVSVVFTVLVLGRVVALLPRLETLMEEPRGGVTSAPEQHADPTPRIEEL